MLKIDMIKKYFNNYNLSKLDEGTEINKKYLTKINKRDKMKNPLKNYFCYSLIRYDDSKEVSSVGFISST